MFHNQPISCTCQIHPPTIPWLDRPTSLCIRAWGPKEAREQGSLKGWKYLYGVLDNMQIANFSWSTGFSIKPTSNSGSSTKSHNPRFIVTLCVKGPNEENGNEITFGWKPSCVFHYSTLKGLWPHKSGFQISDEFKGPHKFFSHGHWL